MKSSVAYNVAANRVADVLKAITGSEEWQLYAPVLPNSDWVVGREPFRRFFDAYEGGEGTDWLGVLEWAVLEQMRAKGRGLTVNPATVDEVIARIARHPNIDLIG